MFTILSVCSFFFFFNDTATTEIYTLSLHDALPIWQRCSGRPAWAPRSCPTGSSPRSEEHTSELQSPYVISYAVFCLKKKKNSTHQPHARPTQPNRHQRRRPLAA